MCGAFEVAGLARLLMSTTAEWLLTEGQDVASGEDTDKLRARRASDSSERKRAALRPSRRGRGRGDLLSPTSS